MAQLSQKRMSSLLNAGPVGLILDEQNGEFQAVNKPLGKMFGEMNGVSGSTILGGGVVADYIGCTEDDSLGRREW